MKHLKMIKITRIYLARVLGLACAATLMISGAQAQLFTGENSEITMTSTLDTTAGSVVRMPNICTRSVTNTGGTTSLAGTLVTNCPTGYAWPKYTMAYQSKAVGNWSGYSYSNDDIETEYASDSYADSTSVKTRPEIRSSTGAYTQYEWRMFPQFQANKREYWVSVWGKPNIDGSARVMNFSELEVYHGSTNVAINQPTSASTVYDSRFPTSNAVNGVAKGDATDLWHSALTGDKTPRWTVKLTGDISQITQIKFYNRTNCCSDRSNNVYVIVTAYDPAGKSLETVLNDTGSRGYLIRTAPTTSTPAVINASDIQPFSYWLSVWAKANSDGSKRILNFSEVVVNGTEALNIAKQQPVSASSTHPLYGPQIAVDGDTNGSSFFHTQDAGELTPRWTVKLPGSIATFSSLTFYNRTNCCSNRSNNIYFVLTSFDPRNTSQSAAFAASDTKKYLTGTVGSSVTVQASSFAK